MHEDHDDEHSHEDIKKQKEIENEKSWQTFEIDFQLEAFRFPDNKIYGIINIKPESARKLIKNLVLVANKTNRINFDGNYKNLCASGFNINRSNQSVYIEAIPTNSKWSHHKKTSKICYFLFTGTVFTLSPTVSFDWLNGKTRLVIQWFHIGDKYAHKYVLYLDGVEIQYIRQKLIDDRFDVRIEGFEAGKNHTFQIAARLSNGKETYRSDLVEFIVPKLEHHGTESMEAITISDNPIPPNLPAIVATNDDKTQEAFNAHEPKEEPKPDPTHLSQPLEKPKPDPNHLSQPIEKPKPDPNHLSQPIEKPKQHPKTYTCCNNLPHKTFPGIDHYFKNTTNRISSSEASSDDDDDDDNDVVVVTSKN